MERKSLPNIFFYVDGIHVYKNTKQNKSRNSDIIVNVNFSNGHKKTNRQE